MQQVFPAQNNCYCMNYKQLAPWEDKQAVISEDLHNVLIISNQKRWFLRTKMAKYFWHICIDLTA